MKVVLLSLCLAIAGIAFSMQSNETEPVKWMSLQEALAKSKDSPRKIYIDLYTGWCGWCKKMDASTFRDPKIAAYLNTHFYPVKMDAETRESISYKGKSYGYKAEYKANEMAAFLLNGQMSYPTAVYMDEKTDPITSVPGYLTPDQLMPILVFFAEDHYKTEKWEDFAKNYHP